MRTQRRSLSQVLVPILLAATVGCARRAEGDGAANVPEKSTGSAAVAEALRTQVGESSDETLARFYGHSGISPVWVNGHGLTGRGEQAVAALRLAESRGLHSADYLGEVSHSGTPEVLAQSEVAITRAMLRFASDLKWGRDNRGLYGLKPGPQEEAALAVATDPDGVEAGLEKIEPPFPEYKRLLAALPRLRETGTPEQVAAVERTLEKWRWLPRDFSRGPIIVNIPEFMLRAYDDQLNTALQMKVVVGQVKHQTPVFSGEISYLVFGPYWNVPESILSNEIVPDIEKDPQYLSKNAYEVLDRKGKVVSTGEVSEETLKGLKSGELMVRQEPGRSNALGRVKFMFPNQNNVYLHDTNAPRLFARENRAASHGCVRVEHPQDLAEWILRTEPEWTTERIAAALKQTKPQQANVSEPVPIFLVYHTASANEAGEVVFHKDIYKLEQQ